MRPEALEHLHDQNVEALDQTYADLLKMAQRGIPGAKSRLREIVELRARLTSDTKRLEEQYREIDALAPA